MPLIVEDEPPAGLYEPRPCSGPAWRPVMTGPRESRSGYPVQIAPRLERVMPEPTPEEVREVHPDLVLDFATQSAREFQQGQPRQTTTAAQAYGQGEVGIEARIRFRVPEIKPRYWRVIFERAQLKPDMGRLPAFGNPPPGLIRVERIHRHQQQAMLVGVDEGLERVENGFFETMAVLLHSRVWLYGYQSVDDVLVRNPVDSRGRPWASLLVEGTVHDGELRVLTGGRSLKFCELTGEVVKGSTQIGQEISEDQAPLGFYGGEPIYPIDLLRGFSITQQRNGGSENRAPR
jgi:hypothetical protein